MIKISDLFFIQSGNGLAFEKMRTTSTSSINFVARGSQNNGIVGKVEKIDNIKPFNGNQITVSLSGSVMEAFYQISPFYTSYHIAILQPKIELTEKQMLYYCMCLRANKYKYSYGRQANKTLPNILIPKPKEIPDYVEKVQIKQPSKQPLNNIKIQLQTKKWKAFKISKLFDVDGTKTTPLKILEENGAGKYPYITTKATNNGCDGFYNIKTENGNVITVDSAVVGYASYQLKDFSASDHVEKLIPKFTLNQLIAMFLTTLLNQEQYRFHYGRKASQTRLKNLKIKLPQNPQGEPDWEFMENYIKSLPYSSSL